MALSGKYVPISSVLDRLKMQANLDINEADAAEWIADLMSVVAPYEMLTTVVTDGNPVTGSPEPITVQDYRAELPCDIVEVLHVFELETMMQLRETQSALHQVNFSGNVNFGDLQKTELPNKRGMTPDQYQIRQGYIYTDYKDGHIMLAYLAWPRDENGEFLVPADRVVLDALTWHIQEKIDYFLFRTGEISRAVYKDTQGQAIFARGRAQSHADTPTDGMVHSMVNTFTRPKRGNNEFRTAYISMGRDMAERIH